MQLILGNVQAIIAAYRTISCEACLQLCNSGTVGTAQAAVGKLGFAVHDTGSDASEKHTYNARWLPLGVQHFRALPEGSLDHVPKDAVGHRAYMACVCHRCLLALAGHRACPCILH